MNWDQWLIVIPARLNSTRLPSKPLADLAGKPLIVRVAERLESLRLKGATIVVATDSDAIVETCHSYDIKAELTSANHPSGTDRVNEIASAHNYPFVLNVQGDEPFVSVSDLELLAEKLTATSTPCMATLVYKNQSHEDFQNPNIVKVIKSTNEMAIYFSRSPIPYIRDKSFSFFWQHQGIYAFHQKTLADFCLLKQSYLESAECLEQLRAIENNIDIIVVEAKYRSIGIDTPEDLKEACETFAKNLQHT